MLRPRSQCACDDVDCSTSHTTAFQVPFPHRILSAVEQKGTVLTALLQLRWQFQRLKV